MTEAQKKERDAFLPALKRLLSNRLYVWNFFTSIFYVFDFMGFGTFIPKYIEYQFRIRASRSSGLAGSAGTAAKAIGLIISGSIVGCPTSDMYGTISDGAYNVSMECNFDCACPISRMQPICSKDGVTNFYSPCQAGCMESFEPEMEAVLADTTNSTDEIA